MYTNTYTSKNGVCSSKTLSSITNTIIEIKDDKNNNSLTSLSNSNDLKSSSSSSLSSNENCDIKTEHYTYEVSENEVKKSDYCVLNSLISSTASSFILPSSILSNNESAENQPNNDTRLASNNFSSSSSSVFCHKASKISNQY